MHNFIINREYGNSILRLYDVTFHGGIDAP